MLMCHSGSADASSFNPGTLVNYLNANGGFTSGGALYWQKVEGAANDFKLINYKISLDSMSQAQKTAKIAEYVKDGYAVIVSVRNGGHWVAVDRVEGNTVYMMDPASGNTDLYAAYDVANIDRLAIFRGAHNAGTVDGSQNSGSNGSDNTTSAPKGGCR